MLADGLVEELWFADDDPRFAEEVAQRSMAASLAASLQLKPFPHAASAALTALQKDDFTAAEVASAIEGDPSLYSRVLHAANSPMYSFGQPLESVRLAVARLGRQNVEELVVRAALRGMFEDTGEVGLAILDHCVGVSVVLKGIWARRRFPGVPAPGLVGLLHDVGKLLVRQSGEYELDAIERGDDAAIEERGLLGYDHAVLGAHAIRAWRIPEPTARAVSWHHQPTRALQEGGSIAVIVSLLRVADALEHVLATEETLDPDDADALARGTCFTYVDYSGEDLMHLWDDVAPKRGAKGLAGRAYRWAS